MRRRPELGYELTVYVVTNDCRLNVNWTGGKRQNAGTPSVLEKLTFAQLLNKFLVFYGTLMPVFTTARELSLSSARLIEFTSSHTISLRSSHLSLNFT
jgi:hypothetical protein